MFASRNPPQATLPRINPDMRAVPTILLVASIGCAGAPISSACTHATAVEIKSDPWLEISTPNHSKYATIQLKQARATCVSVVTSEVDRISPKAYRIPVTADIELSVSDTALFSQYSVGKSSVDMLIQAWSDSNVVLTSAIGTYTPRHTAPESNVSLSLGPLSAEEAAKVRRVTVEWHLLK